MAGFLCNALRCDSMCEGIWPSVRASRLAGEAAQLHNSNQHHVSCSWHVSLRIKQQHRHQSHTRVIARIEIHQARLWRRLRAAQLIEVFSTTQQFCCHDRSLFVLCWRLQSRCVKNGRVLIQTQRVGTSSPRAWLKYCKANLTGLLFSFSISFFLFYFLSLLFLSVFLSFALSAFFFLSFFSLYSFLSL